MFPTAEQTRLFALLSEAAYGPDPLQNVHGLGTPLEQVTLFSDAGTDTQGFVASNDKLIVVSFRGSSSLRDFITDAQVQLHETDQFQSQAIQRLHSGFYRAALEVWSDVWHLIHHHRTNDQPVYFTGHSLGGALAIITAALLARCDLPVTGVVTFGQPRVGDAAFAAWYNAKLGDVTWRFVNGADVVPRSPFLPVAYRHAGHLLFVTALGTLVEDAPWWRRLPSDALAIYTEWRNGRLAVLTDHFMVSYLAALQISRGTLGEAQPPACPSATDPSPANLSTKENP